MVCTPAPIDVETFDAGTLWACYQSMCTTALTACAADCACNAAIATALECTPDAGATACFTTAFGTIGAADPGMSTESCIVGMMAACSGGGMSDAGDSGGGDAGDAGTSSDASDAAHD